MNIHLCSTKTNYTNTFSIPKLRENSSFHNSNNTHASRNNYQATLSAMENQGNSMNNIQIMKVDEHKLTLIRNKLHQQILHTQIKGKQSIS